MAKPKAPKIPAPAVDPLVQQQQTAARFAKLDSLSEFVASQTAANARVFGTPGGTRGGSARSSTSARFKNLGSIAT